MTRLFRMAVVAATTAVTLCGSASVASAQLHLALADTVVAARPPAPGPDSGQKPGGGAGATKPTTTGAQQAAPAPGGLDFSGWIFGSFQYRTDNTPVNTPSAGGSTCRGYTGVTCRNFNQFTLDRAYLTFRTNAGDRASIRVTTDIFQNTDTTKNNNGFYKGWVVRLKYAYLQFDWLKDPKSLGGFTASTRIGVLHTVVIDHVELFWPRYLAQVALERDGWFSSADLGAAALVGLPGKFGEIYATLTNGATDGKGYTSYAQDRFKDYAARLTLTPFAKSDGIFKTVDLTGWIFTGAINSKFAGDTVSTHSGGVGTGLPRRRWGAMLGIRDRRLTAMGEYSERFDDGEFGSNTAASPDVIFTKKQYVSDGFVLVRPLEILNPGVVSPVGALFRFDTYRPDASVPGLRQYIQTGVFWEPTRKTTIALDYQESKGRNGDKTPFTKTFLLQFQAIF